jgi:hypothetical protein
MDACLVPEFHQAPNKHKSTNERGRWEGEKYPYNNTLVAIFIWMKYKVKVEG